MISSNATIELGPFVKEIVQQVQHPCVPDVNSSSRCWSAILRFGRIIPRSSNIALMSWLISVVRDITNLLRARWIIWRSSWLSLRSAS
jgi:hypothetical protein